VPQITIIMKAELHERVALEAARKNRSFAGQVRHFLTEGLERVQHRNGSATALPWLADAKQRLEQMQTEHAQLAKINEADAECRARELAVKIAILGGHIEVAERVMQPDE